MPATARNEAPSHERLSAVDGMAQLSFAVQGLLERRASAHAISLTQTRLLGVLRDREPTMQELASLLGLDKSSTSGLVDRAERRGLVARRPSPTDGRVVLVRLTDDGRALVRDVAARFEADVVALLGHLTASEQRTLSRLISRLLVAEARARGIDLFATGAAI
jgi:MarR family transcriptional regulator, lower aerobic nicotinate degradation pathway regulator